MRFKINKGILLVPFKLANEYSLQFFFTVNMSSQLKKVLLQADVYMVCLQHALSTENFEVMGLLIGDVC